MSFPCFLDFYRRFMAADEKFDQAIRESKQVVQRQHELGNRAAIMAEGAREAVERGVLVLKRSEELRDFLRGDH